MEGMIFHTAFGCLVQCKDIILLIPLLAHFPELCAEVTQLRACRELYPTSNSPQMLARVTLSGATLVTCLLM